MLQLNFYKVMKSTVLFLLFAICLTPIHAQLTNFELRKMYDASITDAKLNKEFEVNLSKIHNRTAVEEAYLGATYAMSAQFVESYMTKFKLVIKAKTHLDKAVDKAPDNPETHFIRFSIEHHLPAYLGMSSHLLKDLNYVFQHLDFLDDDIEMKRKVVGFLLWTNRCNLQQKIKLEAIKRTMQVMSGKS